MNERTFDAVSSKRRDAKKEEFPNEIRLALAQIGRSPEGKKLTEYLYSAHIFYVPPIGVTDGALREHVATQRLARKILVLLQSDLHDDTDGHSDRPNGRPSWFGRVLRTCGIRID